MHDASVDCKSANPYAYDGIMRQMPRLLSGFVGLALIHMTVQRTIL